MISRWVVVGGVAWVMLMGAIVIGVIIAPQPSNYRIPREERTCIRWETTVTSGFNGVPVYKDKCLEWVNG